MHLLKYMAMLLVSLVMFYASQKVAAAESGTLLFSFEKPGEWRSTPLDLPELMAKYNVTEKDLWLAQVIRSSEWKIESTTLKKLDAGLQLSQKYVKQGRYSGQWAKLNKYPTIAAKTTVCDWRGYKALALSVYSESATGDTIVIGLRSGGSGSRDYYMAQLVVDWQGWKDLDIPFTAFKKLGRPAGWQDITAVCFFAKALGYNPNPQTKLFFDNITLEKTSKDSGKQNIIPSLNTLTRDADGFLYMMSFYDKKMPRLNHEYPEVSTKEPVITKNKMFTQQAYYKTMRAAFDYYPVFNPGYVSYDTLGRGYVFSGDIIQYKDKAGKWVYHDLRPVLTAWAKKQGWKGVYNNWGAQGSEPRIRFDNDGHAYVLSAVEALNGKGKKYSWKTRTALLLHSRDNMKSWEAYKLPGPIADFEKLDGHNVDCLNNPPVISTVSFGYFPQADKNAYLVVPAKKSDGSLDMSNKVVLGKYRLLGNYHSGAGNTMLSVKDKVYIVYGWTPSVSGNREIYKNLAAKFSAQGKTGHYDLWTMPLLKNTALGKSMPHVPKQHPGLELSYYVRNHLYHRSEYFKRYSRDGVPTFIVEYDRKSGKLSEPVYLGSGGGDIDNHNWPAITIDSKGILHVLINGHHNPPVYTHSQKPYDISKWSDPVYIKHGVTETNLSYGSLNCDKNDNLYAFFRSTTDTYNNRISMLRKKAGEDWESEKPLIAPFKHLYHVWYHHITYNRQKDELVLGFYSKAMMSFITRDMGEFLLFERPEQINNVRSSLKYDFNRVPLLHNRNWDSWEAGMMPRVNASEITGLVSRDAGDSWSLLTGSDITR